MGSCFDLIMFLLLPTILFPQRLCRNRNGEWLSRVSGKAASYELRHSLLGERAFAFGEDVRDGSSDTPEAKDGAKSSRRHGI